MARNLPPLSDGSIQHESQSRGSLNEKRPSLGLRYLDTWLLIHKSIWGALGGTALMVLQK